MKKIAILMTCYNRVDTTLDCLRRLYAQKVPDGYSFDVWLVDDASPDKTGEIVKSEYPTIHVIQGTGNLFWCKGMRLAWDSASKACDYDFYLWLNDDTMLVDGALAGLLCDAENVADFLAIIVGTCCSGLIDGELSYGCRSDNGVIKPVGYPLAVQTDAMSGNCVLVPRRVYKKIGPIFDGYLHAFGDRDYSLMLKKAGGKKYIASQVVGVCPQQRERYLHLDGKTLRQRLLTLSNPKGFPLKDTFWLKYRHYGLFRALVSCAHVIYLVVFKYRGL